ncbi:hypothetical protein [Spiroplasma alleghenense]|uniref:Uncharacterized protein n=1 Tax=Spiroplasma alleghenense TaxID=216931 RepID=A0A345Z429_9MOLU|nr:hypothetical protein [Spiroplasma alleghenense]AXK51358.1 hypothetical protein SALLE_v1c06880 [Spiroplasma alleghenense]
MSWKNDLFKQVNSLLNEKLIILINEYLDLKTRKIEQIYDNQLAVIIEILIIALDDQMNFSYTSIINSKSSLTPIFIRKNQDEFDVFLTEFDQKVQEKRLDLQNLDLIKVFDGILINLACKVLIEDNKKSQTVKLVFDQLNINNEQFESETHTSDSNLLQIQKKMLEISAWALFAKQVL